MHTSEPTGMRSIGVAILAIVGGILGGIIALMLSYALAAGACWAIVAATGDKNYYTLGWLVLFIVFPVTFVMGAVAGFLGTFVTLVDIAS